MKTEYWLSKQDLVVPRKPVTHNVWQLTLTKGGTA